MAHKQIALPGPQLSQPSGWCVRTIMAAALPLALGAGCCFVAESPLLGQTPAAGTWLERGPFTSGRLTALLATDSQHLWAGAPGGGVWKSVDGGAHWTRPLNCALADWTVLDMQFDRLDQSRMYLRTWNGVLVSGDGAEHWTQLLYSQPGGDWSFPEPATSWEPRPFTQMLLGRTNVLLNGQPCGGLQYSMDNGLHWTQHWPFPALPGGHLQDNTDNCILSIAGDEATGKVYFTTMNPQGQHVYRSTAGWTAAGAPATLQWEALDTGWDLTTKYAILGWGGVANRVLAVGDHNGAVNSKAYLFDGTSWTLKAIPANLRPSPDIVGAGACAPVNPRSIVWGGAPGSPSNTFLIVGSSFVYTTDLGDTWGCRKLVNQHEELRSIFASRSARRIWTAGDQDDLGSTLLLATYPWVPGGAPEIPSGIPSRGLANWMTYTVAMSGPATPAAAHHAFIGVQDTAPACSDDAGATWTRFLWNGTSQYETESIILHPADPNTAYFYSTQGTVLRSDNAAAPCNQVALTEASPPDTFRGQIPADGPHMMAVHPANRNFVYLLSGRSVVVSNARGTAGSWRMSRLPNAMIPSGIFVDERGAMYVGTFDHGVYTCGDTVSFCDGSTGSGAWTAWALNGGVGSSPHAVLAIVKSTRSNRLTGGPIYFLGTTAGVYRLVAGGAWTQIADTPGYTFNEVTLDPSCPSRVYIGMGYFASYSRSRGGVRFSAHNGDPGSWMGLTAGFGLHNSTITQVAVDPASP